MTDYPTLWIVLDAAGRVVFSSTDSEQAIPLLLDGDRLVKYEPVTGACKPRAPRRKRTIDPGPVVAEVESR